MICRKSLLWFLTVIIFYFCYCNSVYGQWITGLDYRPENPSPNDNVILSVNGAFAHFDGFEWVDWSVNQDGRQIAVDLICRQLEFGHAEIGPFELDIVLGRLEPGDNSVTVRIFVVFDDNMQLTNQQQIVIPVENDGYELNIRLAEGWNIISLNIVPSDEFWENDEGPDVVRMLNQIRINEENHNVQIFKDEDGRFYLPEWGFLNIPHWDLDQAYQIKVREECRLSYLGELIPFNRRIPVQEGWNLIPYYPTYNLDASIPNYYVVSLVLDNVIQAKNNAGEFLIPAWRFSNMSPWREGEGYQIKVDQDLIMTYPEPVRQGNEGRFCKSKAGMPPLSDKNMSVLVLNILNSDLNVKKSKLAAFNLSGLCVGKAYLKGLPPYGLAVWGDDETTEEIDGLQEGEAFTLAFIEEDEADFKDLEILGIREGSGLIYATNGLSVVETAVKPEIPDNHYLSNAYPNPFNNVTRIAYGMPEAGRVAISIYDLSGRIIAGLVDGERTAGSHTAVWNAEGASNGLYLIRMQAGGFESVRKVMLIK